MAIRIGINGFGRIGRSVGRIVADDPEVELVAINDLADAEELANLFKYDSAHGTFDGEVDLDGDTLTVDGSEIEFLSETSPSEIPWDDLGVDYALECTGQFRQAEDAAGHLEAGADHVILSAPGKGDIDCSVVMGVNHDELDPSSMQIIDVASCTTNCLAPIAKVLHEDFGIEEGLMTTIHSYTNSQVLLDQPGAKDLRRCRSAAENMVPTTTGAAVAVTEVLPELEGRLDGMAVRVPTPNVSMVDLVATLESEASVDAINRAMREAAHGELEGILGYTEEPLVSRDVMDNPHSSLVDAGSTMATGERTVKVISWYDNEWGFSNRMVDAVKYLDDERD